jgi:hypothetical protein
MSSFINNQSPRMIEYLKDLKKMCLRKGDQGSGGIPSVRRISPKLSQNHILINTKHLKS